MVSLRAAPTSLSVRWTWLYTVCASGCSTCTCKSDLFQTCVDAANQHMKLGLSWSRPWPYAPDCIDECRACAGSVSDIALSCRPAASLALHISTAFTSDRSHTCRGWFIGCLPVEVSWHCRLTPALTMMQHPHIHRSAFYQNPMDTLLGPSTRIIIWDIVDVL